MGRNKKNKKFNLKTETFRKLNDGELSQVAGGMFYSSGLNCQKCSTYTFNIGDCPSNLLK